MDIEGAAHLVGGEKALAEDLHERRSGAGHACRIAVADLVLPTQWPGFALLPAIVEPDIVANPWLPSLWPRSGSIQGYWWNCKDSAWRPWPTSWRGHGASTTLRFGPEPWRRIDHVLVLRVHRTNCYMFVVPL